MTEPKGDVPALLQGAIRHHQAGSLDEARNVYEQVLCIQPNNHDALHLLGVLLCSRGESEKGLQLIRRALAVFPRFPEALSNLAGALQRLGRDEEALANYDRALAIKPDYVQALNNRGNVLQKLGRSEEALRCYHKALAIKPDHVQALNNRGNALQKIGRYQEALSCYHKALAIKPDYVEALNNRGLALERLGRDEDALASYDNVLALKPDYIEALNNRGNALQNLDRLEEALSSYQKALAIKSDYVEALNSLGLALQRLGRLEEALACYHKALAIKPDYVEAHRNESLCHLSGSDFQRGWEKFEWRWQTEELKRAKRDFAVPLWLGKEDLSGKTVLLHAEQGLGDTIQFCRYVPSVAARGAAVILEVPPSLKTLLRSLPGVAHIAGRGESLPRLDFHCPLMSLPLTFGTLVETIPADIPYLCASPFRAAQWRERLAKFDGLKVGLVWAGNPRSDQLSAYRVDRRRSMQLEQMLGLSAVCGVTLVSLQKGEPAGQARALRARMQLVDWTDELIDFADTAALVEALDLVISVDTSVAHLAGALGKSVWVLNRHDRCWRWFMDREDSPWYPTMRLFTQPRSGDWASVVGRVTVELRKLVGLRATREQRSD